MFTNIYYNCLQKNLNIKFLNPENSQLKCVVSLFMVR